MYLAWPLGAAQVFDHFCVMFASPMEMSQIPYGIWNGFIDTYVLATEFHSRYQFQVKKHPLNPLTIKKA